MTCYRRKSTVWPGKLILSKKTPKKRVFWRRFFGITSLWEDLEAKLLTPGQLLGYPWKVWGITVQTSYVEGRWHQNWVRSRPAKKKTRVAMEFREKWKFFVNRSVPESLRTQDSENVYERWVQQIFDPVLPARSWEMPVKCELPAKIGRCLPKPFGHNFHISALKLNQRYFIYTAPVARK